MNEIGSPSINVIILELRPMIQSILIMEMDSVNCIWFITQLDIFPIQDEFVL